MLTSISFGGTVHRMLVTLIAMLMASLVNAAPASADTFDRSPARADRAFIVTAGDSLVSGSGARKRESWPAILEDIAWATTTVKNEGIGGSCLVAPVCGDVLSEHFDERVLAQKPDLIIVGSGRNDLCHLSTKDFIAAYKDLQARATTAGIPIRFTTITPVNADWQWPCEEQRAEVNDWLRTQPGTLDLEARVSTPQGLLRRKFAYSDGLHMNATGYAVAGRFVSKALKPEVAKIVAAKAAARR